MFREYENNRRLGSYKTNNHELNYFKEINDLLSKVLQDFNPSLSEQFPSIFIFGLPVLAQQFYINF